ncbi:GNAT family acetyltransferase [Methylocystis heyeri]|uniref:GNAT family acetyltransferase n=1 Tax=Methylocystis heyeri TaxID=391905 RepID=UPI00113D78ED|nr:GNAT family acetyltransferase [Methylocystis heyeri]
MMETLSRATFAVASVTLMLLALALVGFGAFELVSALSQNWHEGGDALLRAIGYVVIALAVFDVAKYFVEEEVIRSRSLVTTSDVRRSLTKFISTIAIAVFIEGLVIVFQVSKHDVEKMLYPTGLLATAILIVLGLGAYQRLNVEVERQVDRKDDAEQFTAKLGAAAESTSDNSVHHSCRIESEGI